MVRVSESSNVISKDAGVSAFCNSYPCQTYMPQYIRKRPVLTRYQSELPKKMFHPHDSHSSGVTPTDSKQGTLHDSDRDCERLCDLPSRSSSWLPLTLKPSKICFSKRREKPSSNQGTDSKYRYLSSRISSNPDVPVAMPSVSSRIIMDPRITEPPEELLWEKNTIVNRSYSRSVNF